jgi:transposase
VILAGVDIYLGTEPIGLRWGFDRLCGVVTERIGRRPRSGAMFVFFGKRRHAMKVFYTWSARRRVMCSPSFRRV